MPQNKPFNDGIGGYGTAATRENTHTIATDMQALTNNTDFQLQSETTNIIRDESHNESTHNRSIAAQNISSEMRNQIDQSGCASGRKAKELLDNQLLTNQPYSVDEYKLDPSKLQESLQRQIIKERQLAREHVSDMENEIRKKYSKQNQEEFKTELIFESAQSPTQSKQQRISTDQDQITESSAKIDPVPNAEIDAK